MTFRFIILLFSFIANPVAAQMPDSKLLVVDGIQLEYLDIGAGSTTLLIESGAGMGLAYWKPVISDLSKLKIRTVIYSRAGNGKSQSAQNVSLADSNIRLEKLLTSINVKDNLILLGHSFGGLHVRSFAAAQPDLVKGIVLLEPSHERFESELIKYDKAWAKRDTAKLNTIMHGQAEWGYLQELYLQETIPALGITNQIPTVIVTSSKLNESDWWIGHSIEGKRIWRSLHQSLISKNPKSIHIVTDKTGHNVPHENKMLFLQSIDILLGLVDDV